MARCRTRYHSWRWRILAGFLAATFALTGFALSTFGSKPALAISCFEYDRKNAYGPGGRSGYLEGNGNNVGGGCQYMYWNYDINDGGGWDWLYLRGRQWVCGNLTYDYSEGASWSNYLSFSSYNEWYGDCGAQADTWGNYNVNGQVYWSYYLNF